MARPTAALAVASLVLLVALAGCSALPGQDDPPGTTVPGGTPERPTPSTPTATTPPPDTTSEPRTFLAPGLTAEDGVVDARRLVRAHHATLSGTAYTLHIDRRTGADPNDTQPVVDAAFADEPGRFRWDLDSRTADGSRGVHLQAWGNDTHLHLRQTLGGETRYEVLAVPPDDQTDTSYLLLQPTQRDRLYRLFVAFDDWNVTVSETPHGPFYRLSSTTVEQKGALVSQSATVDDATLTATVDGDGVVRRLHAEYDVTLGTDTERVVYDLRVTDVGNTTVERPDWVNTSVEPTRGSDP